MRTFQFDTFRAAANIVLVGIIGFLIGAPASLSLSAADPSAPAAPNPVLAVAFIALGLLVGFKRRKSTGFFYFSLAVACILISIVSFSILS